MSFPTKEEYVNLTPMMRQYYDIKSTAMDCILFFRMGDFYEIFGDDALDVAPKLELVLTARGSGGTNKTPFCGVPHHSAKNYWLKLLGLGYKVAIVDQVEDPQEAKGIVRRDITKIFTPGVIDDLEGLKSDRSNFIAAYYEVPTSRKYAVCIADISTGDLRVGQQETIQDVMSYLKGIDPSEILTRKFCMDDDKEKCRNFFNKPPLFSTLPESPLRITEQEKKKTLQGFSTSSLAKLPCGEVDGGIELVNALFSHLKELKATVSQFLTIKPLFEPSTMNFDATAFRDLEVFETTQRRELKGSLFHEVCRSLSPMGKRALRDRFVKPYISKGKITQQRKAVEVFVKNSCKLEELRETLAGCPDLERLRTRVISKSASPKELKLIQFSLDTAVKISNSLSSMKSLTIPSGDLTILGKAEKPLTILSNALKCEVSQLGKGSEVFRMGHNKELDEYVKFSTDGQTAVNNYEQELKDETGITSLKIKHHKTFGLVIEVTKSNLSKVPEHFIRRQTMVNNERFVTTTLQELDQKLSECKEKSIDKEWELYQALLTDLSSYHGLLADISKALGAVDYTQGLAYKATESNYCKPEHSTANIELVASRHPVVDSFVGRHNFVPNDIRMKKNSRHLLITGPNMAGKSTIMRQVALCALLNQIGSFVPAESAELPIFDQIFTRVGASDDLSRGQSTFMVEMTEVASILRQATKDSLIILDEVGRGTSTEDGLAIASAILTHISQSVGCYSLFATHYHELAMLGNELSGVKNMKTEVNERNGQIHFSHNLTEGAAGSSFGIEVAELAGLPMTVIKAAKENLKAQRQVPAPKKQMVDLFELAALNDKNSSQGESSNTIRKEELEALKKLKGFSTNASTPVQALSLIDQIQTQLSHKDTSEGLFMCNIDS